VDICFNVSSAHSCVRPTRDITERAKKGTQVSRITTVLPKLTVPKKNIDMNLVLLYLTMETEPIVEISSFFKKKIRRRTKAPPPPPPKKKKTVSVNFSRVLFSLLDFLVLEYGTDRLSRNISKEIQVCTV